LCRRVSAHDWCMIVDTAVTLAIAGDATSRAWISKYLLPDPATMLDESHESGMVDASPGSRYIRPPAEMQERLEAAIRSMCNTPVHIGTPVHADRSDDDLENLE
jgi:hypothetical protein